MRTFLKVYFAFISIYKKNTICDPYDTGKKRMGDDLSLIKAPLN